MTRSIAYRIAKTRRYVSEFSSGYFLLLKTRGIARKILQLLEGNDDDLLGSVNFQDFHIIADRMTKSITDHEFLIVGKHHFDPNTATIDSFLLFVPA